MSNVSRVRTRSPPPPPAHPPIHGSCLCQAIQYEVRFPEPGSWPPQRNACHCPQCRHMSGALALHLITVPSAAISIYDPSLSLYEYRSSPHARRAFCCQCGSSLFWRRPPRSELDEDDDGNNDPDDPQSGKTRRVGQGEYASDEGIDVFLGTLDERWLKGEEGRVLATPQDGVLWAGDAIPGVTDFKAEGEGPRWRKARETEQL